MDVNMNKKDHDFSIQFKGIQIKSIEKARIFAYHLEQIEKEFWIRTGKIGLEDCFICPDITDNELNSLNNTAMERCVRTILNEII